MHLLTSLTATGLFPPRRPWRCRTGRLLVLLLQSVGSEWIPALAKLYFWRPRCQQHQSGIWNMVRKGGFSGCLEILCLSFLVLCGNSGKGRHVGLIIKNYNQMNSKNFLELLVLHQKIHTKKLLWVHLSGPTATANGSWRSYTLSDFTAELKSWFS